MINKYFMIDVNFDFSLKFCDFEVCYILNFVKIRIFIDFIKNIFL